MEKCATVREEGYISMNPIISNIITADKGGKEERQHSLTETEPGPQHATASRAMFWSPRSEQCNGWE